MSAAVDTPSEPLTRFDSASAVEPGDAVPPTKKTNARRKSSVAFTQDTAIDETGEGSPVQTTMKARRKSSVAAPDVYNMEDLRQAFDDAPADEKEAKKLRIAPETQKLGWYKALTWPFIVVLLTEHRKLNTPPSSVEDKDALDKLLCFPKLKKVQLHFPHGLGVTARNSKGVTIRDALDAIYKQFKKRVCCFSTCV